MRASIALIGRARSGTDGIDLHTSLCSEQLSRAPYVEPFSRLGTVP
jgi:hypothetical protein